eukprot:scaffold1231_cov187-Pinguiococcus_pyrenoidosus.AAC.6
MSLSLHPEAFLRPTRRRSFRGLSAAEGDLPRDELLKQAKAGGTVDAIVAAHVLDVANKALATWEVGSSHFLRPPELQALQDLFLPFADVGTAAQGGYEDAERRVLFVGRAEVFDTLLEEASEQLLTAVSIEGNFKFDAAGHRDFLGAILKMGIKREFVGDIIILPDGQGAQVITTPQVPFMELELGWEAIWGRAGEALNAAGHFYRLGMHSAYS